MKHRMINVNNTAWNLVSLASNESSEVFVWAWNGMTTRSLVSSDDNDVSVRAQAGLSVASLANQ